MALQTSRTMTLRGGWLRAACLRVAYALGVMALAACNAVNVGTVNVAYQHADWLLQRMAAHYVDLDSGQSQAARIGFTRVHAWHRSQELPLYAEMMDSAASRVEHGLRREDVVWMMGEVKERWQATTQQLTVELTPVLVTLTPGQVGQVEHNFAADNAKFAKTQLASDTRKADKYRTEWLSDQVVRCIGDLTPAQKDRVALAVAQTEDFPALRLAERRRRQAQFLHLVRETNDAHALRVALNDMVSAPREGADEAYRHSVARYEEQLIQMVLDLDRTLTPKQRATAVNRMRLYAQTFRTLALAS